MSMFSLSTIKGVFRDALALRYRWCHTEILTECACGKPFTVEHVLSSSRGGFPTLCHNELRNLTASLFTKVCTNVAVELPLQQLSGEELLGENLYQALLPTEMTVPSWT